MKFDIGTLLYIVVTIIALIASVRGKKKPSPSSESPDGAKKTGFFEKLEEQFGNFAAEAKGTMESVVHDDAEEEDDWLSASREEQGQEPDSVKDYFEEKERSSSNFSHFEGLLNPKKQADADLIKAEAEKSTESDNVIDVIELDGSDNPDYFEIVKDFDLGTAVVYSTIINRKEY